MVISNTISPYPDSFKKTSQILVSVVFVVCTLVLVGWQFDITLLKSIFPGIVNMNPLTALCFILTSVILFAINRGVTNKSVMTLLKIVATGIFFVGLIRYINIFGGFDLGLDQILFHDKIVNVSARFMKNRIAPNTALNFMIIGFALFNVIRRKKYPVIQTFSFITFCISLFATIGYIYSVKNLYGFLAYTPMALNTALCFMLITVAIFLAYPQEGVMKIVSSTSSAGITARRLIPLFVVIPVFLGWVRILGTQRGWYNVEFGLALIIILIIMSFLFILYELLKKLDVVDQSKAEFISLASHQLRTPLSAINWYSEMLLTGDGGVLNPTQTEFVDEIHVGNKRMVQLVNSLLNVSRIDLGTFAVDPEPTDLRLVVKSVLEELQPQILTKKLDVTELYSQDLPIMDVDPKLMRIVIQNLLSNSVKYTQDGGKISTSIENIGANLCIKISDNGYGIPKIQQSKMYSKLFRADNVQEKAIEGTGLGMYIVKAIIDQFHGTITFVSEENKGTTFFISLPTKGMVKKEGVRGLS